MKNISFLIDQNAKKILPIIKRLKETFGKKQKNLQEWTLRYVENEKKRNYNSIFISF